MNTEQFIRYYIQSTSSLDLWEARAKTCDRCYKVFPNEYYYLVHNIKDHIKICLSRNEVYDYLAPKTSSKMKNAEKYLKQFKNNCGKKVTNAAEKVYDFNHLVICEEISNTIEINKIKEKNKIQNDCKKNGKKEFYEENLENKEELSEEFENNNNLKPDDNNEDNVIINKPFVCVCKKKFALMKHLSNHIRRVHSMDTVKCKFCPKVFKSNDNYVAHKRNCHDVPAVCQICNSILASKKYLAAHMIRVHYSDGKTHQCSFCHKSFRSKRYLQIHLKNSKHGYHIQAESKKMISKESNNDSEYIRKEPVRKSTRMYKRKKHFDELEVPIRRNILSENIKKDIKNNESLISRTEDKFLESYNIQTKCKLENDLELSDSVINNLEKTKIPENSLNDNKNKDSTIKKIKNENSESFFIKTEIIEDEIEIEEIQYL